MGGAVLLLVLVLLAVNLIVVCASLVVALRTIARVGEQLDARLAQLAAETTSTLTETREALGRLETLTLEAEHLIHDEASPAIHAANAILSNLDGATRGVSDSVQSVRRVMGTAESLASPAALAGAALKVAGTPRGRAVMAGLAAAAIGVSTVLQGRTKKPQK